MVREFVFVAPQSGDLPPRAFAARLERAYEVQLPDGVYVVTYIEAEMVDRADGEAELIGSWADPAITKHRQGLGFLFPLRAGAGPALRDLADQAFHHRRYEHHQSRRALALTRESLYVGGDFAVFYAEGENPRGAYAQFASSPSVHDVWLRAQLRDLFQEGFDLDSPLPPIRTLRDHELSSLPA
jgi:hypothetical protein